MNQRMNKTLAIWMMSEQKINLILSVKKEPSFGVCAENAVKLDIHGNTVQKEQKCKAWRDKKRTLPMNKENKVIGENLMGR